MKRRLISIITIIALVSAFAVPATALAAKPPKSTGSNVVVPVDGAVYGGGTFEGIFAVEKFQRKGSDIYAVGQLTGTAYDANGMVMKTVQSKRVALPVTDIAVNGAPSNGDFSIMQQSCDILNLTLGPLDLNLLGLRVQLNQVQLDITAEQGPGNLLGNLLCAIAGLLDPQPSPLPGIPQLLNQIVGLLNQILGILNP
jgi:hypothetical protein